ncbi:TetR/AcrR family transcriptional regulator [Streptomyces paludis]|uniref:TetR/AcrR family transcriptional regulator n=1 Tax=Streptomyces paludis TaxID=2282738 RepID=A0A345HP83_9ACTN|nr:TetR/AcrR family transcriptional regulator [Streptomyces paludis]AXG78507.1 TetR/AcrR family transcriptional regulator [Streptomyces paludis]
MGSTQHPRRGDTRQRIQDVALELFAEQGYEKTSLREIAERLDVTKAALYYHFKSKEDIIVSIFADLTAPIDELIAWGRSRPHSLETKHEILRRYSRMLANAAPLFRFFQENQASLRDLRIGAPFKDRMLDLRDLLQEPGASMSDQVRCLSALFTVHTGMLALKDVAGDPEEKREAVLEVSFELMNRAHGVTG